MSISLSSIIWNIYPVLKTIQICGYDLYVDYEWTFNAQGAGDGSGGQVQSTLDFGLAPHPASDGDNYFFITKIFPVNLTDSNYAFLTHTDRWMRFLNATHANEEIVPWSAEGIYRSCPNRDQLNKPLYMGKPNYKDTNPGRCTFNFETNTNSEDYNLTITGLMTKQPLPLLHYIQ